MKKWLTIALVVFVICGGLGAFAIVFGPQIVEDEIEQRLRRELEERGVEANWSRFVAHGGSSFELIDVEIVAPEYGLSFQSDRVEVGVSLGSAWRGDIRLTEVDVEPTNVTIDIAPLIDEPEDGADAGAGDEQQAESRTEQFIRALLEDPPTVRLTDTTVLVKHGDQELARVTSPAVVVEESWGEYDFVFDGKIAILSDRVPAVLRQTVQWKVGGKVVPSEGRFEYRVSSPKEGEPIVRLDIPDTAQAEVGSIWGEGTFANRTAALNVDGAELMLGPGKQVAALHAKAPTAAISLQENGRPKIEVRKPTLYVAPARLGQMRSTLSTLLDRGAPTDTDPTDTPSAADTRTLPRPGAAGSAFARFNRLVAGTDVVLDGLAMGVHVKDDAGDMQTLTLLERLDTTIRDGLLRVDGETARGKIFAEAEVLPGQRWPHYMVVRAEGVRLEKVPGLASERTALPSRGTSGTIAGRLDLNLALTMPPQGMKGHLLQPPGIGEFHVRWTEGVLDLTGVAAEPVEGINASVDVRFVFEPQLARIRLEQGDFRYGPIHVEMTGEVTDFPLDTQISADFETEEVDCEEAVHALPKALLGPYAEVDLEGTWAPSGRFKLPLYRPKGFRARFDFEPVEDAEGNRIEKKRDEDDPHCEIKGLNASKEAWPDIEVVAEAPTGPHRSVTEVPSNVPRNHYDDVYWMNRPFVKQITEGLTNLEEVEVFVGPGTTTYMPIDQLPSYVGGSMYLSEQIDFYEDGPVSFSLMKKAMRLNLSKGRFVYGGSTVTQQLVKNLFLTREKTFARKIQEALISWRVDTAISKDRVLELYLNCIEFGPDIYGIGPAAQYYFQKDARQLSPKEAIFLAMLKPSPWRGETYVDRGRTPRSSFWTERYDILFDRLVKYGFLTRAQADAERPYDLEWEDDGTYVNPNAVYVPLLD